VDDDGRRRIAYKPVGGSRAEESEIPVPDELNPEISAWSRDGKVLLAMDLTDRKFLACTEAGGWERVSGTGEGNVRYPTFSPDARWLAFASAESGKSEVLVKPFGRPGGSEQVSVGGGWSPIWTDDGRRIYRQGSSEDPDNRWIMVRRRDRG
jgi:Tol biopolymer transport system component